MMADKATFQMVIRSKIGAKTLPCAFQRNLWELRGSCERKRVSGVVGAACC